MADTTAQTIDLRGYWILDCRDPDDDWRRYVADLFATEDGSTLLALRDDRCGPYSTNPEFDREVGAWVVATEDGFRSELVRGWRIEADHPRLINRSGPEPDWSFVQDYWQ